MQSVLSKKCLYALRALFYLSQQNSSEPVKTVTIAEAQAIPLRFLEVILAQLRQAGFVQSHRGNEGGYSIARSPQKLTIGEVIHFLRGNAFRAVELSAATLYHYGDYAFAELTDKIGRAMSEVYDNTTFADLLDEEAKMTKGCALNYSI